MSKSDSDARSRILITDSPRDIKSKIRLALTDSKDGVSYSLEQRPGVSNLLQILSYAHGSKESPQELATSFKGKDVRVLKQAVTDGLITCLRDIREGYDHWTNSIPRDHLFRIAIEGADKANTSGNENMNNIRKLIGLELDNSTFNNK